MKFAVLLLMAATTFAAQTKPTLADDNSSHARALLAEMIQALGGQTYLTYQTRQDEGRTYGFYQGQPNGVGAPFWRFWQWPDKERVELLKHREWVVINNGDQGMETTYHGAHPEDPKELANYLQRRKYSLEYVLRRWLQEPGSALFYEGRGSSGPHPAEKVSIMNPQNESVTIYIDLSTHLPVRKVFTVRDPQSREKDEEAETYDNYKPVQGIQTPFDVVRWHNGQMSNQRFFHSVSYNNPVAASLFTLPEASESATKSH